MNYPYKALPKGTRFLSNVLRPEGKADVCISFNESWARKAGADYPENSEWVAMDPGESVEVL